MKTYRIENTRSGADMGTFEGESPEEAILAMHRDAGYASAEDAEAVAPTEPGAVVAREILAEVTGSHGAGIVIEAHGYYRWMVTEGRDSGAVDGGNYGTAEEALAGLRDALGLTEEAEVTDEQIEALALEACTVGDIEQAYICDRALGRFVLNGTRIMGGRLARDVTLSEARAECARVIADARAQA